MKELALLLDILNKANLATPAIVSIIDAITNGRKTGQSDEEIQAASMKLAEETRDLTAEDMGEQA